MSLLIPKNPQHLAALDRRGFVLSAVAVGGGVAIGLPAWPALAQAQGQAHEVFNWVVIAPDNTVTLRVGQQEMGQGTITTMAQLLGEELEIDWNKMKTELASVSTHLERNKVFGRMATNASRGVTSSQQMLRTVGAQIRGMLIKAAAAKLNVPEAELVAENSTITHRPSGRKVTYGEVAADAAKIAPPDPATLKLKDPRDWKLIGKSVKRLDVPMKADGSAIFGIDVRVPGMKYAAITTSPVFGGKLKSYDRATAMRMPGVRGVVEIKGGLVPGLGLPGNDDDGIAVVADTWWQAKTALDSMAKEWDGGEGAKMSTASYLADFRQGLTEKVEKPLRKEGDAEAALQTAAKKVEAEYWVPYLEHATMEPHNYTALVTDDRFELWGPVQDPERAIDAAAKVAGLPVNKGKMNYALLGGGFGRKGLPDYVIQAVQIAKAMKGTPVKMVWTREETTRHGFYRPSTLAKLVGGLDAAGNLNAWTYRIVAQSPLGFMSWAGADVLHYVVPNVTVDFSLRKTHVPLGPFRGVGFTQNCFFHQSFLDEMAVLAGKDAYTFQRALLDPDKIPANAEKRAEKADKTRNLRRVLDEVVKKAEWTKPLGPNRGRGLAIEEEANSHVGIVAEVTLDGAGWFKVDRVVIAADTGYLVNPDNATSQLEGSVAFSLSAALYGEITIQNGRVVQGNFDDYQMLRVNEMPKVEVIYPLGGKDPAKDWGGIGEPSVGPIMAATANAIYNAGGPRIRSLPLKNETIEKRS